MLPDVLSIELVSEGHLIHALHYRLALANLVHEFDAST